MPYFQAIKGGSSDIIIDDTYTNLCMVQKGTISGSVSTGLASSSNVLTYTGENPVLALTCSDYLCVAQVTVSSNTWTWVIYFYGGPGAFTATYYIFDNPPSSSATNGLQVFNSSGKLLFDASRKYMRIVASSPITGTYSTTPTYAFVFATPGLYTQYEYTGLDYRTRRYATGFRIVSGVVSSSGFRIYEYDAGTNPSANTSETTLLLDVTGF